MKENFFSNMQLFFALIKIKISNHSRKALSQFLSKGSSIQLQKFCLLFRGDENSNGIPGDK